MKNPEIHPAVDVDAIRARQAENRAERERFRSAFSYTEAVREAVRERNRRADRERNRRADRDLLIRAGVASVLWLVLYLVTQFDLMAWQFSVPVMCMVLVWFAVWLGAWMQFRFSRKGLLQ
jgi:protein-S-isoprenylcysteine O-methyltransferase Ste14